MSESGFTSSPNLVPARMLNEYTYCPRLFFIEWVQARFVDNTFTVDGRYQHRNVDKPSGSVPEPDEGEFHIARSVVISSEQLGLVAKIDLIESAGDSVIPVEYKRGRPPDTPERAYEPERVQVCAQGLILRDAGYRCDFGILYFAETRERVEIPFDDELVTRTRELVTQLRSVAEADLAPPPLVDSPKCNGCSLVGICLPDETNALASRTLAKPRRLTPSDPDERPLYVTHQGAWVTKRKDRIEVTKDKEVLTSLRLIDISQLCIFGNVQISTQLIRELFAREIPVCWFTYGGWFSGIAEGLPSKHVELRRRQVATAGHGALLIARRLIEGKIRNTRTMLMRNARQRPQGAIDSLKSLPSLTK